MTYSYFLSCNVRSQSYKTSNLKKTTFAMLGLKRRWHRHIVLYTIACWWYLQQLRILLVLIFFSYLGSNFISATRSGFGTSSDVRLRGEGEEDFDGFVFNHTDLDLFWRGEAKRFWPWTWLTLGWPWKITYFRDGLRGKRRIPCPPKRPFFGLRNTWNDRKVTNCRSEVKCFQKVVRCLDCHRELYI